MKKFWLSDVKRKLAEIKLEENEAAELKKRGLRGSARVARENAPIQLAEIRLKYLYYLLQRSQDLSQVAKEFVRKEIKTRTRKLANLYITANRPRGALEAYAKAKLHRKGAKHLLVTGHPFHAAELYRLGNAHFYGATQLAKTNPQHSADLFIEAKKPLKGARILMQHHAVGSRHAYYAAQLYKEATAYEEGIKAMQKINRPDLLEELKRHQQHAPAHREYRRITDEFLAVRQQRLHGKP